MPDTYQIRYTAHAASQLRDLFDYIEIDSPTNAAGMTERILAAIESLEVFPQRYALARGIEQFPGYEIRSMPVRPYLVRYHVSEATRSVTILSIRHGARKPGL